MTDWNLRSIAKRWKLPPKKNCSTDHNVKSIKPENSGYVGNYREIAITVSDGITHNLGPPSQFEKIQLNGPEAHIMTKKQRSCIAMVWIHLFSWKTCVESKISL